VDVGPDRRLGSFFIVLVSVLAPVVWLDHVDAEALLVLHAIVGATEETEDEAGLDEFISVDGRADGFDEEGEAVLAP